MNTFCSTCGEKFEIGHICRVKFSQNNNTVSIPKVNAEKKDYDKPTMQLLPSAALLEISKVLDFGARKYSADNWRHGLSWSRLYGATLRHLFAHKDGQDLDEETKLSHLAHAGCCILFLLEHELKKLGKDDRWSYEKK